MSGAMTKQIRPWTRHT